MMLWNNACPAGTSLVNGAVRAYTGGFGCNTGNNVVPGDGNITTHRILNGGISGSQLARYQRTFTTTTRSIVVRRHLRHRHNRQPLQRMCTFIVSLRDKTLVHLRVVITMGRILTHFLGDHSII